jgi:hypothetical protein
MKKLIVLLIFLPMLGFSQTSNYWILKNRVLYPASSLWSIGTGTTAYSNGAFLDTVEFATKFLKNADSTTERAYSNALYPLKTSLGTSAYTDSNYVNTKIANAGTGLSVKSGAFWDTVEAQNRLSGLFLKNADSTTLRNEFLKNSDSTTLRNEFLKNADSTSLKTRLLKNADSTTLRNQFLKNADSTTMRTEFLKNADSTTIKNQLLKNADSTTLKAGLLKNADSTTLRNEFLKNADSTSLKTELLKNADSTTIRNYDNALYSLKAGSSSLTTYSGGTFSSGAGLDTVEFGNKYSKTYTGSQVYDFGAIAGGQDSSFTITVTGASVGNPALLSYSSMVATEIIYGIVYWAEVSSTNVVKVHATVLNGAAGANPPSRTYYVTVVKNL